MSQPFELSSRYYDLLYQEKDSAAEAAYVDQLLQRHGIAGSELLDFGSGTGRHGCLLASRGYRVHGLERSAAMVAAATVPTSTSPVADATNDGEVNDASIDLLIHSDDELSP